MVRALRWTGPGLPAYGSSEATNTLGLLELTMMRIILGVVMLAAALVARGDNCIQIDEPHLDFANEGVGAAVVQWRAALRNQCRKTFDADLTIQLLDEKEETIYEFVEKTTLGVEERQDINRDVYVPSRIVDRVNDFAIHIEERERQH